MLCDKSQNLVTLIIAGCALRHPHRPDGFLKDLPKNTLPNHFLKKYEMFSKPKMDILNKTGGVVSIYNYNPLKQRADCDLFVFYAYKGCLHIFDAPFLLQETSLRKDMRRRGQNCSGRICHTLQVRAPTLTSHACICTGLNGRTSFSTADGFAFPSLI